ncbi:hypothetical protein Fot_35542 [Forsythia ovata]|uniref:Uncharacterized protein n=1 Tax=Forsythia ovata TaxID=205694 RepID=A0ABD1SLT8_9LAMI
MEMKAEAMKTLIGQGGEPTNDEDLQSRSLAHPRWAGAMVATADVARPSKKQNCQINRATSAITLLHTKFITSSLPLSVLTTTTMAPLLFSFNHHHAQPSPPCCSCLNNHLSTTSITPFASKRHPE